jgi:amino acid transporter
MLSTDWNWTEIILALGSIFLVAFFTLTTKYLMYRYKRPNGKKGGILSLHTAIAFTVVAVVALTTKDWFTTFLVILLAYIIARGRMDEGQHYMYQVVMSVIIGIGIPYGLYYLWYHKQNSSYTINDREDYDKPDYAEDNRHEADDEAPDLRLDDL